MKHQISLVGGQLLPIYLGLKEFSPDRVHFIVSNESKNNITKLKSLLSGINTSEYSCNAFDFYSIKGVCEKIIEKINPDDEVVFNLTSGTKIMVLAAQAIIHEKNLRGFYINQDDSYLELPIYQKKQIQTQMTIQEFFDVSGHHFFSAKKLNDYNTVDYKMAHLIDSFASTDNRYTKITSVLRKKYNEKHNKIPLIGKEIFDSGLEINWSNQSIIISSNGKILYNFNSPAIFDLFFNAAWWELLVAEEVGKWLKAKEIIIKCELPFASDKQTTKNEIDILLNTGKKLIFVECKSGYVKQEDINKMKVIKQTYGGIISKSILVSRFIPSTNIIEKCNELDIELFYCYMGKMLVNPLSRITNILDKLEKKLSI